MRYGAGPRGSQALVLAAKARAALRGEAAADVDDVRALVVPALRHRLVLSYRAEADGVRDVDVLRAVEKSIRCDADCSNVGHMLRRSLAVLLTALTTSLFFACGEPVPCIDAPCACSGGSCDLDCELTQGCAPTCEGADDCKATCDKDCDFSCKSGTNCAVACGDQCKVHCSSASTCGAQCGAGCAYTCESVNDCAPTVGDASTVVCTSVGNCNVTCTGSCSVTCTSVGNCNVNCKSGNATTCPDGRKVCGQDC